MANQFGFYDWWNCIWKRNEYLIQQWAKECNSKDFQMENKGELIFPSNATASVN